MVNGQQQIQQVKQRRIQLERARKEVESATRPQFTRQQLAGLSRQQRRQATQQFEQQRQQAQAEIGREFQRQEQLEKQVAPIQEAIQRQRDIEAAQQVVDNEFRGFEDLSKRQRQIARQLGGKPTVVVSGEFVSAEGLGISVADINEFAQTTDISGGTFTPVTRTGVRLPSVEIPILETQKLPSVQLPSIDFLSLVESRPTVQEIFTPRTDLSQFDVTTRLVSRPSPGTGGRGTLISRPPTPDELAEIQRIQEREARIIRAPLTFLEGGFEFQQRIEESFIEDRVTPEQVIKRDIETPTLELFRAGDPAAGVRSLFFDVGQRFVGGTETLRTTIFGGERITEQEQQQVGVLVGGLFLGNAFSPVFATGAGGTTTAKIKKQLSKNKFEELEDFIGAVESEVATKGSALEQARLIKEIKDFHKLTPEQTKNLIKHLKDKNIIRDPKVEIKIGSKGEVVFETKGAIKPHSEIIIDVTGLPQTQQAGQITGIATDLGMKKRKLTLMEVEEKIDTSQLDVSSVGQSQLNLFAVRELPSQTQAGILGLSQLQPQVQVQVPRAQQIQRTRQLQTLASLLSLAQPSAQAQRTAQQQVSRQAQRTGQPTRPRPPRRPTRIPPLLPSPQQRVIQEAESLMGNYESFARKRGRDVSLGEFGTKREAKDVLRDFLSRDISASGTIKKAGREVDFDLGFGFRKSKINPKRQVEMKQFRLDSGSEVFQIKQAKRRKMRLI